ncbi:hypothetical protein GCM10028807_63020 [Spirosoma daeguense]
MPTNPTTAQPKVKLTLDDYKRAAKRLNVDVATIRAVTQVESGGSGFMSDGRCIIRFEPHLFSRKTGGKYDQSLPLLSFPKWKPGYPKTVTDSWRLFEQAAKLNANAAVQSSSWGLFQILGQHALVCGCETLGEFVKRMEESEASQLDLFCEFIIGTGLDDELQTQNWTSFARQYNGKLYAVNRYDIKLKSAYDKYRMDV